MNTVERLLYIILNKFTLMGLIQSGINNKYPYMTISFHCNSFWKITF